MRLFHGRKFVPLDPPSFLDHKGTEIIIIGASDDLKAGTFLRMMSPFLPTEVRSPLHSSRAGQNG